MSMGSYFVAMNKSFQMPFSHFTTTYINYDEKIQSNTLNL